MNNKPHSGNDEEYRKVQKNKVQYQRCKVKLEEKLQKKNTTGWVKSVKLLRNLRKGKMSSVYTKL